MHANFSFQHISSAADIIISRPTHTITELQRNMLWGYPALYRQFEQEVLPTMQAVDELRSRTSQVQQQSQNLNRAEGFGPPPAATLPPSSLRSEDEGGPAERGEVSTTGLASDAIGGHATGLVSLDSLDQNSASISSTVEPTSVVENQDIGKAPSLPPIAEEAEAAQADNNKSWGSQGSEAEKVGKVSKARTPDIASSPIPPEIEMEDLNAKRVTEADSSVCLL